ncbi:3-alpha,7-alpha,12-alpha-trihydroxy-5-beta-cholest-24-enoyl-CoA hydratase [Rhizobium sp. CRIBSB]|nr:3-alpha,7-alpha,12-alpha-trihydroxy-5-beta-cholest-24-enoyl-CoA hydratase [Rhizobium sp. CRIBSB]
MAIDHARLMARAFPEIRSEYSWKDCALYALGLGLGSDPLSQDELRHVYEKDLEALPTMAVTLGHPGFWISEPDTGIDFRKVVHGEQTLVIHHPLRAEATMIGRNSVEDIVDKGEGRGALLRVRRDLFEAETGLLQSSQTMTMFCRGDGGFGGPASGTPSVSVTLPDRPAETVVDRPTPPQAALIYRLGSDLNPLHADPAVAAAAGFDRPILHGLGTFGIAGFALMTGCGRRGASLRELGCRFTAPFFPGETLRTEIWQEDGVVLFRCTALERGALVLDRGRAIFED